MGAIMFALTTTWAGSPFSAVWYPDGKVNYWINDKGGKIDPSFAATVRSAMNYVLDYTPVEPTEVSTESESNLEVKTAAAAPECGGYTWKYWDETRSDSKKNLRFDPKCLPNVPSVLHEFGHALGFPHEFQRADRDSFCDVCFNTDPFNYSELGSIYWPDPYYILSQFDYASVMNDGYTGVDGCVSMFGEGTRNYDGVNNPLSIADINSLYRMYGKALGTNDQGDRFGVAVSAGDYDGDGYEDIVVANLQDEGLWLEFYRGVGTNDVLSDPPYLEVEHVRWEPWFKVHHDPYGLKVGRDELIALATGDFNGDGIDDLAVGQPGYNNSVGRVSVLFVNTLPSISGKDYAPWGHNSIESTVYIQPTDIHLYNFGFIMHHPYKEAPPRFGAALGAVHATGSLSHDDLVIGAPGSNPDFQTEAPASETSGAVIIIQGGDKYFTFDTHEFIWNPETAADATSHEFGSAITGIPGLCDARGGSEETYNDFIAIGAPGYHSNTGVVHLYGCATDISGALVTPALMSSIYGTTSGYHFGQALAGLRILLPGDIRQSYLAIGEPSYMGIGRVQLFKVDSTGTAALFNSFSPTPLLSDDNFGATLAVQQRPYALLRPDEAGFVTYLGIGMPGPEVPAREGEVFVWRPINPDGTANSSTPYEVRSTDARFGIALAPLRNVQWEGGFVVGAPDALTSPDNVPAGMASILENSFDGVDQVTWKTKQTDINQETGPDSPPSNL